MSEPGERPQPDPAPAAPDGNPSPAGPDPGLPQPHEAPHPGTTGDEPYPPQDKPAQEQPPS